MLPLEPGDAEVIAKIWKSTPTLSPPLADASLVHLANRESIDTIFTLDRRDFSVYRLARNRRFRLLPELLTLAKRCRSASRSGKPRRRPQSLERRLAGTVYPCSDGG